MEAIPTTCLCDPPPFQRALLHRLDNSSNLDVEEEEEEEEELAEAPLEVMPWTKPYRIATTRVR